MKITKNKILLFLSLTLAITNYTSAQKIAGYSFEKYPTAQIYKGLKAKVNLKSSETARAYRTTIKEQYINSKIDFAGKYSFVFWGAGTGLTLGAMVDNKTGNVYDLPLDEKNSAKSFCGFEIAKENNKLYNKKSNLFVTYTWSCKENQSTNTNVITKYYSYFLWNETNKKFTLIKNKNEKITEKIPTN